jgi:SpoVK/Ycf46/Vps4 family AAA+-type ATPase
MSNSKTADEVLARYRGAIAAVPAAAADSGAPGRGFNPDLVNASDDLVSLRDSLVGLPSSEQVSFLLSGPPGTSKSETARWFASELKRPLFEVHVSDVLSKYVGEAEQVVRRVFREAEQQGAVALFDEADSYLTDRRYAQHGFERSLANEFLTRLESHRGLTCCTTNLAGEIDPAALRRFVFKIEFDYLTAGKAALAFEHFFGMPAPAGLDGLMLAPGDFAAVSRKARILRLRDDASALLKMIRRESDGRKALKHSRAIGFGS